MEQTLMRSPDVVVAERVQEPVDRAMQVLEYAVALLAAGAALLLALLR